MAVFSELKHPLHEKRGGSCDSKGKQKVTCLGKWKHGKFLKAPPQINRKRRKLTTAENCQSSAWTLYRKRQSCSVHMSPPVLWWAFQSCSCFWLIPALLRNPSATLLLKIPIKTHWFIRLDFGAAITLFCWGFSFWGEQPRMCCVSPEKCLLYETNYDNSPQTCESE